MKEKNFSIEIVRIVAMCLVIYNHTGMNGYELFRYADNKAIWLFSVIFGTVCKAGVPLFFMISGALLLEKDETIGTVLKRRVFRYVLIIFIFSFAYYIRLYCHNPEYGFNIIYFVKYIYSTPFIDPYWFLYAYVAFLIMLPFLRAAAKSLDMASYGLILVSVTLLDYICVLEKIFGLSHINLTLAWKTQTILYPILGYGIVKYIAVHEFKKREIIYILFLLTMNIVCSVYMVSAELIEVGNIERLAETNIAGFSFIPAVCLFYSILRLFENRNIKKGILNVIEYVGGCAFGVYLFEDWLRSDFFLSIFSLASTQIGKLFLNIPYILCMVLSGVVVTSIIRKIPGVKVLRI